MMRVAVVGHVEWVEFIEVDRFPHEGDIAHAERSFTRAAGGGGVVAVVLAGLGADVDFFCALGRDANGEAAVRELTERGIHMEVAWRDEPTRRAVTLLGPAGERTIITIGDRLEPLGRDQLQWERLGDAGGVYFTAGDAAALERARQSSVVVASPRARDALEHGGPPIDALVFSDRDTSELAWAERVADRTRLLVGTDGDQGGRWWGESEGSWSAAPPPGPPRDSYGCGDSFAAGFTYGLAGGASVDEAAELGARCGARTLTISGAP